MKNQKIANKSGLTAVILLSAFTLAALVLSDHCVAKDAPQDGAIKILPSHYKPLAQSSESLKGKAEFAKHNCAACHSIDLKGGCLAPPLDGVGSRRSKSFILARITNEPGAIQQFAKLYPEPELLVHPRLSASQARLIASYLLTLPEPKEGFRIAAHKITKSAVTAKDGQEPLKVTSQSIAEGRALFSEHGCLACHSVGNMGGHFAPRLDGIAKRRDREFIADRISNAEFMHQEQADEYQERGAIMPPSDLNPKQIQQVTTFLMSLKESR